MSRCRNMLLVVLWCLMTASCGASLSTTAKSSFKLRMQGVYTTATGATGDNSPQSETYQFTGITLTLADGTGDIELYDGDPTSFKIIDRPQLLYANYDMSAYDAISFSQAKVKFSTKVDVVTRTSVTKSISLTSGDLLLTDPFTISKAQAQNLTIKISWGKTVTTADDGTESIHEPSFTLKFASE